MQKKLVDFLYAAFPLTLVRLEPHAAYIGALLYETISSEWASRGLMPHLHDSKATYSHVQEWQACLCAWNFCPPTRKVTSDTVALFT